MTILSCHTICSCPFFQPINYFMPNGVAILVIRWRHLITLYKLSYLFIFFFNCFSVALVFILTITVSMYTQISWIQNYNLYTCQLLLLFIYIVVCLSLFGVLLSFWFSVATPLFQPTIRWQSFDVVEGVSIHTFFWTKWPNTVIVCSRFVVMLSFLLVFVFSLRSFLQGLHQNALIEKASPY